MTTELVIFVVCLVVNALLSGSEIAIVSLRHGQLQRLEARGERGRRLAALAKDPTRFLTTVQIGITLSAVIAGSVFASKLGGSIAGPLEGMLGERPAEIVGQVLAFLVITYLSLVVGELVPKRFAMQRAESWGLLAARPLDVVASYTRPAVWLLSRSTDLLVRFVGGNPHAGQDDVTEEEIKDLIAAQTEVDPAHRAILSGAFDVRDRTLREILTPRNDVVALQVDQPATEGLAAMKEGGHTRAPVYDQDIDDVKGVVHVMDLVGAEGQVGDILRMVVQLPESMGVLDALQQLQIQRQQLAMVYNEHGSTEGVVTVEDLLEEIVGELYDEFDPDLQAVERDAEGAYVLPGDYPIHDLPELDVDLPEGPYTTVAGYALAQIGQIAEGGEVVESHGWRLEVLDVERRRITRVRLGPLPGTHHGGRANGRGHDPPSNGQAPAA